MNGAPETRCTRIRCSIAAELCLWLTGIACVGLFLTFEIQQRAVAQQALREFYSQQSEATVSDGFVETVQSIMTDADRTLWSDGRIETYESTGLDAADSALAVLRVPRLSLEAPVFEGALDAELDRGPGRIRGTAQIGTEDNIAIAGHRDGFFRALKDIEIGDSIEILGRDSRTHYRVTETWIVEPEAVHVLDPTPEAALTLVTCYPFYYVGHAPQRFIVRAVAETI